MDAIPKPETHFLIDLSGQKVFCRLCRQACKSLTLPRFTLFWCNTRNCENSAEARLYPNDHWAICTMMEIWEEEANSMESVSEIKIREILSIDSECRAPDPI